MITRKAWQFDDPRRSWINHRCVEGILDKFMEGKGWVRTKALPEPDRIFCWPGQAKKLPLAMEIKPEEITVKELDKGIGQCVSFLQYQVKSYYVIHERYFESIERSISQIPIGVLLYKSIEEPRIILARRAPDRDVSRLLPLDAVLIRADQELVRGLLFSFLIENYLKEGWYPLGEIVAKMADAFPLLNIRPAVIGHMLTTAGFAKKRHYQEPGPVATTYYYIVGGWQDNGTNGTNGTNDNSLNPPVKNLMEFEAIFTNGLNG